MYKYKKKKFYIKSVAAYIISVPSFTVLSYVLTDDFSLPIKIFIGGTIIFLLWAIKFADKHINSFVEFKDDSVLFNSFYISSEANDYLIKYTDIEEITASTSIFGKITDVYIKTKEYDGCFEINSNYENHIKLYDELCKTVKIKNPDAEIDERIYDLINKNNN